MTKRFVLGVDGGGTRTRAAIADQTGTVLGSGSAGTTNHDDVHEDEVAENLDRAVTQALSRAGVDVESVGAAFLGLAGVVSEQDHDHIRELLGRISLGRVARIEIDHDIRIALAGGLAGRPGVAIIAGTGAACYGRTRDGRFWQSGGWGHLLADEGSGYWLGLEGLKLAVRMFDGRASPGPLAERLLGALGIDSPQDVMYRVYVEGVSRAELAGLAPEVLALAEEGDWQAHELIERGAQELLACVAAVTEHLALPQSELEITYTGGVLQPALPLFRALERRLSEEFPGSRLVQPMLPPVLGACLLALRLIGNDDAPSISQLIRTANGFVA